MENRKLTIKQKRFAQEYIKLGDATNAAIKAGYSKNTASEIGYENLSKPHIAKYIKTRLDKMDEESIADEKEVMRHLTSVMRGELTEEVFQGLGGGLEKKTDKHPSISDRIRAAELIGKRYSLFTDRVDIEGDMGVVIIDDIPSEEE